MSRFEEVSPEKIKRIAWKFTKTVIADNKMKVSLIFGWFDYRASTAALP